MEDQKIPVIPKHQILPHLKAVSLELPVQLGWSEVFMQQYCFYNLGEGLCESCSFSELQRFLSFIYFLSLKKPLSRRECFSMEDVTTQ